MNKHWYNYGTIVHWSTYLFTLEVIAYEKNKTIPKRKIDNT